MNGIGKHATFYHAYLPHDRSLIPVAVALAPLLRTGCASTPSTRRETRKPLKPECVPPPRSSSDLSATDRAEHPGDPDS